MDRLGQLFRRDFVAWGTSTTALNNVHTLDVAVAKWQWDPDVEPIDVILTHTSPTVEHLRVKSFGLGVAFKRYHQS